MKNKKSKAEKIYLVGFVGARQTARYSKRAWASYSSGEGGVELMTLGQARKHLLLLADSVRVKKGIYKVVLTHL